MIINAFKEVYAKPGYIIVSLAVMVIIFSFNVLVINLKLLITHFSFSLLFDLLSNSLQLNIFIFALLLLLSLLSGIVVAMVLFLVRKQVREGLAAGSSILFSIIAPSCSSCALGLLSILGLGGFLSVLPFKGLEIGIVGVLVLIYTVIFLSKKINSRSCTVR